MSPLILATTLATSPMAAFGYLVGAHDCDGVYAVEGQPPFTYAAQWDGWSEFGGRLIADTFRMRGADGAFHPVGRNYRTFSDSAGWTSQWFDAASGRWTPLGQSSMGGTQVDGQHRVFNGEDGSGNIWRIAVDVLPEGGFDWTAALVESPVMAAGSARQSLTCRPSTREVSATEP